MPQALLNNLSWKLISVTLATIVWIVVRLGVIKESQDSESLRQATRVFTAVPVKILKGARDRVRYRVDPENVQVKLKGPSALLEATTPGDLQVVADFTRRRITKPSRLKLGIKPPEGLEVEALTPETVSVTPVPPKAHPPSSG